MSELCLHIDNTSAAYRTLVGATHVLPIAVKMDTVTALHEDYGLWGCEHVLAAYWTIAVCRSFDATMRVFHFDREAYAACLEIYELWLGRLSYRRECDSPCSERSLSQGLDLLGIFRNHGNGR